jgi:TonB family protein
MIDSTARAERLDLPLSEPAFYTWEVVQKPVVVRLPLTLIDRLESEAVETFRSLSSRGSEIGGLLLGTLAPGSPAMVTVADYELVPCDYSRGPLYRLSDADLGRFERAIETHSGGAGPRVIGYFRSHTRKGLVLDAEDIAFFEPRFLEPQHIALLVRPFATRASTAGIFIRENGRIGGDTCYLEFPFRSAELKGTHNGGEKSEPAAPATPVAAGTAAPAPKPPSRAQIVPIASRREIALPEPVASAQPAAPIVADRVEVAAPAPPPPQQQIADRVAPAAPAPPRLKKDRADAASAPPPQKADRAEPAAAPAQEEKERAAAPAPPAESEAELSAPIVPVVDAPVAPVGENPPAVPGKNKKLRLTVAAAVGMLVLVGGALVLFPTLQNRIWPRTAVAQQDSSPLSLRVERTSGGLQLSWDLHSPVIQAATKVMLGITDGDRHENIQLDPNQVRSGSIVYPPITGDVSFQMEVTDPHQAKTSSESLRVLDPRPSPLADPADALAQSGAKAAAPGAKATVSGPGATDALSAEEAKLQEETPAPHPTIPLKPFSTESLAQRLRPVTPTDLPEAPALVRTGGQTPGSLSGILPSQPEQPPQPKPAAPAPASMAPGGQLLKAEVISRKEPEYPRLARQAGASGMVELEATIGVDGRVKNPHVLKGNAMLQRAAIDAVMEWRYKPAMLNGKAVESPVEIKLNFVGR